MKALLSSLGLFIRQIYSDSMLLLIQAAPILAGLVFKYAVPFAAEYFGIVHHLEPYYLLFDVMYAMLMPYMLCFASALIILSEIDDAISAYLFVTPLGKKGYVISRLIFPAGIGFLCNLLFIPLFSLTDLSGIQILVLSFLAACNALITALFTVSFAGNRVEGMGLAKISTIILLGAFVPFFIRGYTAYVFYIFPSYWLAQYLLSKSFWNVLWCIITIIVWIRILYSMFNRKIEK